MKGDFTRLTFDPTKHYSRVFEQQGRVQVDSDWNEMNDIHRHFLRRLAADLIGPHGGPGDGFLIGAAKDKDNKDLPRDFALSPGHYYVDGVLCENDDSSLNSAQQLPPPVSDKLEENKSYLGYLDVWERHVTAYEDEDENRTGIREVALRGPDTATRSKVIWQVKCRGVDDATSKKLTVDDPKLAYENFRKFLTDSALGDSQLRARSIKPKGDDEPCLISPESKYRGAENQLYRVEIHRSGIGMPPGDLSNVKIDPTKLATFKWSRENGSVIFPITRIGGDVVTVRDLGRDTRFGLHQDDWVEVVNDDYILQNRAEPLLQVKEIDRDSLKITLKTSVASWIKDDSAKHPYVRRWDMQARELPLGALAVVEGGGDVDSNWITLEDGVQIQFQVGSNFSGSRSGGAQGGTTAATYRTGDYWLIPARVATGDVEWPGPPGTPLPRPPRGVEHVFAPLGIIAIKADGTITLTKDLRRPIKPLSF
jgi:hypothetical protein